MSVDRSQLKKELTRAGAKAPEADDLADLAARLELLRAVEKPERNRWTSALKPAVLTFAGSVSGAAIVIYSQSAAPTSWLYPVQKISDAVATQSHPEYRATVMMRRAEQVHELVASHASSHVILSTLASYNTEATAYKALPNANYAAFVYCRTYLKQAAAKAPADVRQSIISSLDYIDAT